MTILIKILQMILSLSILIVIHELGHFTFSKIFKTKVDKFYLFFDAGGIYFFSTKRSRWFTRLCPKAKDWDTDYGIGWLPFGGYCKINGMVDESMDTTGLAQEPKPWELRSKPAWQRVLVMFGGVLYNFIFAILCFIAIMYIYGDSYVQNKDNAIYVNELSHDMGFRNGDRILSLDDYVPENFGMIQADIARRGVSKVELLRDGDTVRIYIDRKRIAEMLDTPDMFSLAVPFVVDTIPDYSVNAAKGLVHGDRIVEIDGNPVTFVQDSRSILQKHASSEVSAAVLRDADTLKMTLQVDSTGRLGILPVIPGIINVDHTIISAIPAGIKAAWSNISGYVDDLKMVAKPSTGAYKSVGSFISLGKIFPDRWNWYVFLYLMGMLSIMLGVVNLLPIPGLDGGHILFNLYEMITRKKLSVNFLIVAQMIGMALIFMLMFLALGNDISRL